MVAARTSHGYSSSGYSIIRLSQSPFVPPHSLAAELAISEGRDGESTLGEGRVRLRMALPAQGDQAVAIKVRAPLGAFLDVMHLEAVRGKAARLAPPTGAGQDLGPDLVPGLETR